MNTENNEKPQAEEPFSQVILNLHNRIFELEKNVITLSGATQKFSDSVVAYVESNDKKIDGLHYRTWFLLAINVLLIWKVFFQ